eukprot:COSAG02_NODE_550_length_20437_cov_4.270676_10_plen_52_part_00
MTLTALPPRPGGWLTLLRYSVDGMMRTGTPNFQVLSRNGGELWSSSAVWRQ